MHQNNSSPDLDSKDLYLTVSGDPGQALDATALWNAQYSYSLQRVAHSAPDSTNIETRSDPTPAITVFTRDIYPPAAPTGLAVVLSSNNSAGVASISPGAALIAADLSWLPNSEPDLAGYILYRRVSTPTTNPSLPAIITPITAPGFSDSNIYPGNIYTYCVSAVDTSGNESPCSSEESISVPTP
jgi:hypothetical protein